MARVACAISAALICAKSFFCSTSLSDTESLISCSSACGASVMCGCDIASWTRREAGGGFFLRVVRQRHRIQHVLPVLGGAEEQVEGLRENQRMLVALDEDRLQGGEHVGAVADLDQAQRVQRIDHGARPDRNPGSAQRAGKADHVVRDQAGGRWSGFVRHTYYSKLEFSQASFPDVQLHIGDAPLGAGPRIHTRCGGYGFRRCSLAPRNDDSYFSLTHSKPKTT